MVMLSRQTLRGAVGVLASLMLLSALSNAQPKIVDKDGSAQPKIADKDGKGPAGFFVPIEQAKDCAYDHVRQRLYVTTLKQLVVVDMKERKIVESIDLLGNVQGIDISPGAKFLAIAPIGGQFVYKVKLDWKTIDNMEISRIKFKAEGSEPGVFAVGIGADDSILFTTTFAGSGGVKARRINPDDTVDEIGRVQMNTVIALTGDRQKAFLGEGNISSGPLQTYDFKGKSMSKLIDLQCFYYELACSADGSRLARPQRAGCDLYDGKGSKLGTLEGAPVIAATFNPKSNSLYVMRHGELSIQEYNIDGKLLPNSYPLDRPLVIKGDVNSRVVADPQPVGRDTVIANFRRIVNVNFRAYQSGRLHVTDDGKSLCAVLPNGVYVFDIQEAPASTTTPKPKVKIIDK